MEKKKLSDYVWQNVWKEKQACTLQVKSSSHIIFTHYYIKKSKSDSWIDGISLKKIINNSNYQILDHLNISAHHYSICYAYRGSHEGNHIHTQLTTWASLQLLYIQRFHNKKANPAF